MPARIRRPLPILIGVAIIVAMLAAPSAGAATAPGAIPGRYIVMLRNSSTDFTVSRLERDTGVDPRLRYRKAIKGFSAKLSRAQVRDLRDDPAVVSVTPDYPVHADAFVPLAPGEPTPPSGVRRIQAATSTTARQASNANVAIIDTGIDLTHPQLNAVSGKNCINTTPGAQAADDNGHGSHVAGIVGARNDGSGVVGVAPGTKLYAVKVLNSSGSGSTSQVICGIDWVAQNAAALGIKVANMSLSGATAGLTPCAADPEHQAICNATNAGVTFAVAAGNDNTSFEGSGGFFFGTQPQAPAIFPEVLTVTAESDSDGASGGTGGAPTCRTGELDDYRASFSNYAVSASAQAHTIAAPGVCIRSTWMGGGFNTISGTSMASPHVAGAIALCLGDGGTPGPCAGMTPAQIIQKMRSDAQAHTQSVPGYGFRGDPSHLFGSGYMGYLTWAGNAPAAPPPTPPVVTTGNSTAGVTTATVNGTVNPSGGPASYHFEYGPDTSYGSSTPTQTLPSGTSAVPVSANLSGLSPNSTYHYKLVADNGGTPVSGGDQSLTTNPPPAPVLTTSAPSPLGSTTATLKGTVNPSGFPASYHFEYGPDSSYGTSTPTQTLPAGSSPVAVSAAVNGLSASSTYHFKLVADNGGGPVSSGDAQFTTNAPPPPPVVTTGGTSNVGASGVTVAGTVNPSGLPASYHFEYGTDTSYGKSTPTQSLSAGNTAVGVTAQLSGLLANTTYHYKLVADNGGTPVSGDDAQFQTLPAPLSADVFPSSVTVETGSSSSGTAAALAAADASYYTVQSAAILSPLAIVTSWYGTFTGLPASPANLKVSYTGNNSATCSQSVQIFRWSDSTWVNLDTRNVGTSDVAIANLAAPGAGSQYVNGGSARVRVRCQPTAFTFFASNGNLLKLTYG